MRKVFVVLMLMLPFFAIGQTSKTPDGVIVTIPQGSNQEAVQVRLKVINDNVVRVSATEGKAFDPSASLIAVCPKSENSFDIKEDANSVSISTKSLVATVSKATGAVKFTDLNGKVLLQEPVKGGKTFKKINVEGTQGYEMRQVFDSPDDEAFYGLGQHQSDEYNYKGKNETLFQYNTKVSVPFIQSNKGYGLLWDNYSLTRFGDPREYANLDQFVLYGADGKQGGLTAKYYASDASGKPMLERSESTIDYEDLSTVVNFPKDFPFNNGSKIVWTGKIEPKESGLYKFSLNYAGYTKVFVNDKEVVAERWRTAWNPNTYKFDLQMKKGQKYNIRVEWKPDGGVSYIGLKALSPVDLKVQGMLSLWSEMGDQIDYYFIKGTTPDEVVEGYRYVTGKSPIMPKWAMGFWQSRERYKTADELLGVVKEYRKRQIPLDNIVLDWSYWPVESWGSHEFDVDRFLDPQAMIKSVHDMDAHIMISVWPKFYITTQHYKEFDKRGWMYQQAVKDSVRDWIAPGYIGSFYDAYSADARKLFWDQMNEHIYSKGMDAWWMDASEPDIVSNNNIDYRKKLCGPTAMGPSTKYFNTYALMNAQAIFEGQRSVDPNKRVFLLTRSGFAGLQRYSTAVWSGDIGTRWEDMKAQISAGLNFAMSGIPYWTMDIGGFCVEHRYENAKEGSADLDEWRELNARWFQFGAFCPLFRVHGQYPFREIYNIAPEGHPAYSSLVYYDKLRYRLMPYIYTLASKTYFDDYTIMRALVMDFGNDSKVTNISDQYMFGPSLMVCPVYKYKARNRNVYFPEGKGWYDFYTGKYIKGGLSKDVDAPYERTPLYVKAGSIIPAGGNLQYASQKSDEPVKLLVYTGGDGSFSIYGDDGVSYDYENGNYSSIPLSYNDKQGVLTIGACEGKLKSDAPQNFEVVWVTPNSDKTIDSPADARVAYNGTEIIVKRK